MIIVVYISGQGETIGNYLLHTKNSNRGARPTIWGQTFAVDVFFAVAIK